MDKSKQTKIEARTKKSKKISKNNQAKPTQRRKSLLALISPNDVTEGTLQVWRSLPSKIRADPSLAPFQQENERIHGDVPADELAIYSSENVSCSERDSGNDFIHIHVTNENGVDQPVDEISSTRQGSSVSNITNVTANASIQSSTKSGKNPWHTHAKLIFLFSAWFLSMAFMATENEKEIHKKLLSVDDENVRRYLLPSDYYGEQISLTLEGAFLQSPDDNQTKNFLSVSLSSDDNDLMHSNHIDSVWRLPIPIAAYVDNTPIVSHRFSFRVDYNTYKHQKRLTILLQKNTVGGMTVRVNYDPTPVDMHVGVVFAIMILCMFYVLIIYEIVHRTFAAIFSSVVAIGVLSALHDRPVMTEIVRWMNCETLMLLFSMMILVAILNETGVFNYIAVIAFKVTNGRIWPLIFTLCFIAAILSAFLHNVTMVLLMTPITIKLCECLGLNPVPILMAVIINGNLGAVATPLGHIPNLLIAGNPFFVKHGVTFLSFTSHTIIGVLLAMILSMTYLRFQYRDFHELRMKEPKEVTELRREIIIWERTAATLSTYTRDSHIVRDTLLKKVKILRDKLRRLESEEFVSTETYKTTLDELKQMYPIKDAALLIKSGIVLAFIITLFFLQSIPMLQRLSIGWCSLIGIIFLLIIAEKDNIDALVHRIEWATLLFFAAMFVTLECLERLRLIQWIGQQTIHIISIAENEKSQLALAIVILLWMSALLSSLVDSVPVTAMMIKVIISISDNDAITIPIQPLVWAVAFGPCFGGNGTLYGASANIICVDMAEQHGYKITFSHYFRKCFPIMIISIVSTTVYLLVAHVLFDWNASV